jgi:hypothetical protein
MASDISIVAVDYDPPGRDVQGEHVILQNTGLRAIDLTGWALRDSAAHRPHVYRFGRFVSPADANVRIWTKSGTNTSKDLFWGRAAAVWNNPGDTAILLDQAGGEISRFVSVPLPPGASTMKIAVPAFWDLSSRYQPHWDALNRAGPVISMVVIDGSWPATAKAPPTPTWKQDAVALLDSLPGVALGYVSTRVGATGPLRNTADILNGAQGVIGVKDWYDEFAGHIAGIYFDELVLPGDPGSAAQAQDLITQFRAAHPSPAKLMLLAGQCLDAWVVGPEIDWVLLWESHRDPSYDQQFYAAKLESGDPSRTDVPSSCQRLSYSTYPLRVTARITSPCPECARAPRGVCLSYSPCHGKNNFP